jgi:hypothetical protein
MGCDIHLCVEQKIDGKWVAVKRPSEDTWDYGKSTLFWLAGQRSYNLFSILANVRNEQDVDGCNSDKRFSPIAMPKGLPTDMSPDVQANSDDWGCDGHSHSFHLLQDLLDYDWTQTVTLRGWLSLKEYWQWSRYDKSHGEGPDSYCGGIGGGNIEHITQEELEAIVKPIRENGNTYANQEQELDEIGRSYYGLCTWEQPYYKTCRAFLSDSIPQLLRLGKPEDVRIVFWFDN